MLRQFAKVFGYIERPVSRNPLLQIIAEEFCRFRAPQEDRSQVNNIHNEGAVSRYASDERLESSRQIGGFAATNCVIICYASRTAALFA